MEILENHDEWSLCFREGWLAYYERTGALDWSLMPRVQNRCAPAGPAIDLVASRLMLVTSSGAHLPSQEPFDAASPLGDYTVRAFPSSTPLADLRYAHDHYPHEAVERDPQVLIPLRHLDAMVAAGAIGELAPSVVSFMGYQPDAARVADETAPAVVEIAQKESVQAVLLVPS